MAKQKKHWQVSSSNQHQQQPPPKPLQPAKPEIKGLDDIIKQSDTVNLLALKKAIEVELQARLDANDLLEL